MKISQAIEQRLRSGTPLTEAEREHLLRECIPLIRTVAGQLSYRIPPNLDQDDLISVGCIGLLDALSRYDGARAASFKTYAELRIRGAMIDEIRSNSWMPRKILEKLEEIQAAEDRLLKELGRSATEQEVAAQVHLSTEELREILVVGQTQIALSIQDLDIQENYTTKMANQLIDRSRPDPLTALASDRIRGALTKAISELTQVEQQIMGLYYQEELTMKEIGHILKMTESSVSRQHTRIIMQLKAKLKHRMD